MAASKKSAASNNIKQHEKENDYGRFANKLRERRDNLGVRQDEIASELGMSTAAYGYYERGERTPTPAMVWSLAKIMGIDVLELLEDAAITEKPSLQDSIIKENTRYQPGPGEPSATNDKMPLSDIERRLIIYYRSLSTEIQEYVKDIADKVPPTKKPSKD